MQSQCEIEAVDACRLQNHFGVKAVPGDHSDEFFVTLRFVRKIERIRSLSTVIDDHGEDLGTDIDPDMVEFQWVPLFVYTGTRSPDPETSPTRLVNSGSWASDTLRHG